MKKLICIFSLLLATTSIACNLSYKEKISENHQVKILLTPKSENIYETMEEHGKKTNEFLKDIDLCDTITKTLRDQYTAEYIITIITYHKEKKEEWEY